MGGETGSRSGNGSGSYREGHGYQSNNTMLKSTIPGIFDSVYVTGYVGTAAKFSEGTDSLARHFSVSYRKGGTMIA